MEREGGRGISNSAPTFKRVFAGQPPTCSWRLKGSRDVKVKASRLQPRRAFCLPGERARARVLLLQFGESESSRELRPRLLVKYFKSGTKSNRVYRDGAPSCQNLRFRITVSFS